MRITFTIVICFLTYFSFGQTEEIGNPADTLSIRAYKLKDTLIYHLGFTHLNHQFAASIPQMDYAQFNQGNISDPFQLVQGKFSGLLVSRAGNNPNESFVARIRGVSSMYLSSSPLIIIDGMPSASLLGVDPLDVQKITMTKDAASSSVFGLQSLGGAMLFTTFSGEGKKLTVTHYSSVEVPNDESKNVLSVNEYKQNVGLDLGSETNWFKEITRPALSHVTHISYGDKIGDTEYYTSLNYRNTEGVLKNSGFTNINSRLKINQSLLNNRISLGAQLSYTDRESNFSFPEAFKYSSIYSPTAPIFNPSGSYFENLFYDFYNPVAMVVQNSNKGKLNIANYGAHIRWNILPSLYVAGAWNYESQRNEIVKQWSKESYWMGQFSNGLRRDEEQQFKTHFSYLSANYAKRFNFLYLDATASYSSQSFEISKSFIQASNFLTDEDIGISIYRSTDFSNGGSNSKGAFRYLFFAENKIINSFRSGVSFHTKDVFYFNVNVTNERCGDLKGTTLGLSSAVNLFNKQQSIFTSLKPRLGYGVSAGALPFFQNYNPQNLLQAWQLPVATIDYSIKPEKKAELNVGVDWGILKNKITGSFNFFTATTKKVLTPVYVAINESMFTPVLMNNSKIKNEGIEIDLRWMVLQQKGYTLSTSINFSTLKNTLKTISSDQMFYYPEPELNQNSAGIFLISGKPVGQVKGYVYDTKTGTFSDEDHNGIIDMSDRVPISNPLPKSFLGWSTQFNRGRLKASMMMRGAFGHTVLNLFRGDYENDFISVYNRPRSILTNGVQGGNMGNSISTFYVEKASYFKLDNIHVSYDFYLLREKKIKLTAFLTAQNLFTISNYKGNNPEVRIGYKESQIMSGFDSQYTYASSKTYLAGLQVKL